MKKYGRVFVGLLWVFAGTLLSQEMAGQEKVRFTLIDGYVLSKIDGLGVVESGIIYKPNGLKIEFEEGLSQGYGVKSENLRTYEWSKEQTINGRTVKFALIKKGIKTVYEPENPRDDILGNILLVTIPLGNLDKHAINFQAEIVNESELVDALLMILTYR